jgi:hypothetical protein
MLTVEVATTTDIILIQPHKHTNVPWIPSLACPSYEQCTFCYVTKLDSSSSSSSHFVNLINSRPVMQAFGKKIYHEEYKTERGLTKATLS